MSFELIHINETESTNSYLGNLCKQGHVSDFTVVWADYQLAGRGQRGNSWESAQGKNLTFSYVLHPHFIPAHNQFALSEIASLAVKDVLSEYVDEVSIKWPNDIYWKEKKICGMLIEHNLTGKCIDQSICGIGINVNQEIFHSSAPNPVSLKQIVGTDCDRTNLLSCFIQRLQDYYTQLEGGHTACVHQQYMNSLFRGKGIYSYRDSSGIFKARIVRIEPNGMLVLQDERGRERTYMFKEVEYVL